MPVSRVLYAMERHGVLLDVEPPARAFPRVRREDDGGRSARPRRGGPAVQPEFAAPDTGNPVREARAARPQEDARRHAVHRRGRARAARPRSSAAEADPRVPRPVQAQVHLYRQAAGHDQSRDRARAHHLRAGGGGDRAAREQRSQPAEHPDPHRGGPPHPRSVHRAAGQHDRVGRLLAGRAAHHGAYLAGREPAEGVRLGRGHTPRDGRRDLRHGARGSGRRAAALRQGDQFRADLRHVGVRARAPARDRALGGAAVHGPLLRALSRA